MYVLTYIHTNIHPCTYRCVHILATCESGTREGAEVETKWVYQRRRVLPDTRCSNRVRIGWLIFAILFGLEVCGREANRHVEVFPPAGDEVQNTHEACGSTEMLSTRSPDDRQPPAPALAGKEKGMAERVVEDNTR